LWAVAYFSSTASAQDCEAIFPGPAQNSTTSGRVLFNWEARVFGAEGNELATTSITEANNHQGTCGVGIYCTASGDTVPQASFGIFPGGPNINTYWYSPDTYLTPGDYGSLEHRYSVFNSTIFFAPGTYTFSGQFSSANGGRFQISSPGSVRIFVQNGIDLGDRNFLNTVGSDRYLFLYSAGDLNLNNETTARAALYGDDVRIDFQSQINGAVTAEGDLELINEVNVTYDQNIITSTDFGSFCSPPTPPELVAEWRLDESSWSGSTGEVLDYGPNGLQGSAIDLNGVPSTQAANPAIAGNPGTCGSGDFNGVNDGYVEIPDPGTNSVLDLDEFSVTVWVYPRAWPASGLSTIVSKDENFEFHLNNNGQINWWWLGASGSTREFTSSSSVGLNAWHHIAITYESGSQVIYLDGISVATNNSSDSPPEKNNDSLHIGADLQLFERRFNGLIDEVRIYDGPLNQAEVQAVMAETHVCVFAPALDHFAIDVGGGSASTCSPEAITITAEDVSNNAILDYTGTIALSTSTNRGNWAKTGTASDALGDLTPSTDDSGAASYAFEITEADQGSVILNLSNSHAETLTITASDSDAGVSSTSLDLQFSENALDVVSVDSLADDVVAGRPHLFELHVIKRDPVTGDCGIADEYDYDDVALKAWITRAAADPSATGPEVSNDDSSFTGLTGAEPGAPNVTMDFENGIANFTLQASDVGRYALNFSDESSGFSDSAISGDSTTLVARPFALDIQLIDLPANPTANVFKIAGEAFTAEVRAVAWQSADDANDDGIADGHNDTDPGNNADLSDNTVLPAFGQESPREGAQLSAALQLPAGGADPGLGTTLVSPLDGRQLSNFSSGTETTNSLRYNEVGVIEMAAAVLDGDYLSAGPSITGKIQGRSGLVGRFRPSYFVLSNSSIAPACNLGGYSYMEETLQAAYQLTAYNLLNAVTQNYTGSFALFNPLGGLGLEAFGAIDAAAPTPLSSRANGVSDASWGAGTADVLADIVLSRSTTLDGPFDTLSIGVVPIDSDGVTLRTTDFDLDTDNDTLNDHASLGQTSVYFGRLRLADAFGPETADLPVAFVTEYWDGSLWRQNEADSCTQIGLADISYPGGSIDSPANLTMAVGGGTTTGTYRDTSGGVVSFDEGNAGHYFTAPGAGNTGNFQVDVSLSAYPWLRFDWDDDGSFDDISLPSATFTFGSYRGHDRIIYWREVLRNP